MMLIFLGLAAETPLWAILGTAVLKAIASMCNEVIVVLGDLPGCKSRAVEKAATE